MRLIFSPDCPDIGCTMIDDEQPEGRQAPVALADDLRRVIDRHRQEWETTYAEAVGVLHIIASDLIEEARDEDDTGA